MRSLILRTATRLLMALLLLFSVYLLLRGHNEPGGGFVGGLVAAGAFALYAIAYDVDRARRTLRITPRSLVAVGLIVAVGAGVVGLATGRPFLTGKWVTPTVPGGGEIHLGTPLLFDVGVFLVVVGSVLTIIFNLAEE